MKHPVPFWVKLAAAVCVFITLKLLISYIALSSFAVITIDAEFDHDDNIDIYFSSGINGKGFRAEQTKHSEEFSRNTRSAQPTYLHDHVARKLRIDLGIHPGTVKLYNITLKSYYGSDITFDHQQIFDSFLPNEYIDSFTLQKDHVLSTTDSDDSFIVLKDDLVGDNFFLRTLLPLILTALLFIFISRISIRSFPAFRDIDNKVSSIGVNYGALDGIRGLAALLVLGQHTGVMKGSGIFGVWLFFCLSGFLLATPFIRQPDRALSWSYMSHYVTRRIKRIIPMYFAMITVTILFLGKFDVALRHYLFLQADGHYWTVAQEMFFYLVLPVVMVANFLLFRNRKAFSILFLGLFAYLGHRLLTKYVVPLYGDGVTLKPMIGIFMIGILAAYIFNWALEKHGSFIKNSRFRQIVSVLGLLLLTISLLASAQMIPGLEYFNAWSRRGWFGLAAGLLILLTLLAENTALDRLFSTLPLRAIGLVGFSFYLLHPMMISVIRGTSMYFTDYYPVGIPLFILAGLLTHAVSIFTYSYIERPFIKDSAEKKTQQETVEAGGKQPMPDPQLR